MWVICWAKAEGGTEALDDKHFMVQSVWCTHD